MYLASIVPDRVRLPLTFDPAPMVEEIARLGPSIWQPHFNTEYYSGDWSGVALRSRGGTLSLYPGPPQRERPDEPFTDTVHVAACPALARTLAAFACPLTSVRLLRLGPGAAVREHRDYQIGFEAGELRVHVPLETSEDVAFILNGTPLPMAAGEAWYVDVTQPHAVRNDGASARIHLVIDCVVDDWLRALLDDALASPFDRFASLVAQDDALERELFGAKTIDAFTALAALRASERGISLDEPEIHHAMTRGLARWHAVAEG
jgi:hypothetical protein